MSEYIVIMAGGSGTRMKSVVPKQLLNVGKHPMLVHLFEKASYYNKEIILIVSNSNREQIVSTLLSREYFKLSDSVDIYFYKNIKVHIVVQPIANGTGGALMACCDFFKTIEPNSKILVLSADVPLIMTKTIQSMFNSLKDGIKCVILTKDTSNNFGYGRIVTDSSNGMFVKITEEKDCDQEEKKITLVNTGIYCFQCDALINSLQLIDTNNAQKEYYLTDCPKHIGAASIKMIQSSENQIDETMGANTPEQYIDLLNEYSKKYSIENVNHYSCLDDEKLINLVNCLNQLSISSCDINGNLDKIRTFLSTCDQQNKHVYVVKYEHMVVGTGSIFIEQKIIHGMGKVGHIEDIVIDQFHRGNGMSKKLIDILINIAKENECYKIILNCSNDMIEFYEKIGFNRQANCMRIDL